MRATVLLLASLAALAGASVGTPDAFVVHDDEGELPVTPTGSGIFVGASCARTDFTQVAFQNTTRGVEITFRVKDLTALCPGEPPAGAAGEPRVRFTLRVTSAVEGTFTVTLDVDPATGLAWACHFTESPDGDAMSWCAPAARQVADPETSEISYRLGYARFTPPSSILLHSQANWDACGVTAPCNELRTIPYGDRMPDEGEIRWR